MTVTDAGIFTEERDVHPSNRLLSKAVSPSGNAMPVRAVQLWKANLLMLLTLCGICTVVSAVQDSNASRPMAVMPFSIVTVFNPVQP